MVSIAELKQQLQHAEKRLQGVKAKIKKRRANGHKTPILAGTERRLEKKIENFKYEIALQEKKQRTLYQMGGWGGTGSARLQRADQGNDFEIPLGNWITAPGDGEIIGHSSDRPWPVGFGSPYAIVKITSGAFAIGNGEWYVGHCNRDVRPIGTKLKLGDPIARANNSLNSGWGWCELGKWDGGPHEMGNGLQYRHLFAPVRLS